VRNKAKRFIITALGASVVCIFTALLQIPIPGGGGYINPGDAFIYIFACSLPFPYGIFAGSIGASLADIFTGWPVYALPTFIIKSLMAVAFTNKKSAISPRNILALLWATVVLVSGYFVAEIFLFGKEVALVNTPYNTVQGCISAIIYIFISAILSKSQAYKSFKEGLL